MLARAEHSYAIFHFEKGIPLIVPGTHFADSEALKLQSVSLLYNAQQGDLDVADARGGVWFCNHTTSSNTHNESQAVKGRRHRRSRTPQV
jgi:hypothetical protein